MTHSRSYFSSLDERTKGFVTVANGEKVEYIGKGKVDMSVFMNGSSFEVTLENVLLVPCIDSNLISVSKLCSKGHEVLFSSQGCAIEKDGKRLQISERSEDMYIVKTKIEKSYSVRDRVDRCCVHEWHRKLAHRNYTDILAMKDIGLNIIDCECDDVCESCIVEKITRKPFPKKAKPTEQILDCIVSDICGPMPVTSVGGFRYFATFIDVHSKCCAVYLLKSKDEIQSKIIEYLEFVKNYFEKKVKVFRTDRGSEYMSGKVQDYLRSEGIQFQCTIAYSPEQNGIAERKNRTLVEACRAMLTESGMPREYWDEAIMNANYNLNRVLSKGEVKTPFEKFTGTQPDFKKLQEFGCNAYVMIPKQKRKKLDSKAEKLVFVGYSQHSKGYRLADVNKGKIIEARDVIFLSEKYKDSLKGVVRRQNNDFDEVLLPLFSEVMKNKDENQVEDDQNLDDMEMFHDAISLNEDNEAFVENPGTEIEGDDLNGGQDIQIEEEAIPDVRENIRVSSRVNKGSKPQYLNDYVAYSSKGNFEPKTYKQAMNCADAEKWRKAMEEEIESITRNKTWNLAELPYNKRAIGCKWVYKLKSDEFGKVCRYKARLVAQGFNQKFGVDYDEVFAPVARPATFRILLSMAGANNYCVKQFDIKTAFLNGDIEEEIYMRQPPGFEKGTGVCKLNKSLYGLKQSARVWNKAFNDVVLKFGFVQNEIDKCLYSYRSKSDVCYLIVHVDDILVASNNENLINEFKYHLAKYFEMKDMGNVKHFLGIDVNRDDEGNYIISQSKYIDEIVEDAKLSDGKTSKFPLMTGYYRHTDDSLLDTNDEYRKLIGKLLYISTNTRPDITAAVGILSKKVSNPSMTDMVEVKRVIRYLNGTKDLKLKLSDVKSFGTIAMYSDASWAEDPNDRKSTTGYCCRINGGIVSWCSRKQELIALSSMESEYIALSETCKELKWVRMIMKSFHNFSVPEKVDMNTDSQSSMKFIKNQKFSNRSKHIDIKFHYVKHLVESGEIDLIYCRTDENIADMFTKPLGAIKLSQLRSYSGLVN
jgi:transposase InsO family protein